MGIMLLYNREYIMAGLRCSGMMLGSALVGLAMTAGCGDNLPPPRANDDASTSTPPIDAPAIDAETSLPPDAALADAAVVDAIPADAAYCTSTPGCTDDGYECNDVPLHASLLPFGQVTEWYAWTYLSDGYLCSTNDDWYRIQTSTLGYDENHVYIRLLARDAGFCGMSCDEVELPPLPENTAQVDVYDSTGTMLLATRTSMQGVAALNLFGPQYDEEFLIHVSGPIAAQYSYRLSVEVRSYDGEDECEC